MEAIYAMAIYAMAQKMLHTQTLLPTALFCTTVLAVLSMLANHAACSSAMLSKAAATIIIYIFSSGASEGLTRAEATDIIHNLFSKYCNDPRAYRDFKNALLRQNHSTECFQR